jgi:hypothetical protein
VSIVSRVAYGIGIATLVQTMAHLCIGGTTFHRLIGRPQRSTAILFIAKIPHHPF